MVESGDPVPDSVAAALDIWDVCQPYWAGFLALHGDRPRITAPDGTMIAGPIPYASKAAYAKDHGAETQEDLDEWVKLLTAMDDVFQKHVRDQLSTRPRKG